MIIKYNNADVGLQVWQVKIAMHDGPMWVASGVGEMLALATSQEYAYKFIMGENAVRKLLQNFEILEMVNVAEDTWVTANIPKNNAWYEFPARYDIVSE